MEPLSSIIQKVYLDDTSCSEGLESSFSNSSYDLTKSLHA